MKARSKARVLVIEDETIVAMDIERGLQALGYDVVATSGSGETAIDLAEQHKPDLVLMDIRLRGRLDGIDAARIIRQKFKLPIVFLTAHADAATVGRAKGAEPFGYLLKPFEDQELHTAIEIALYKRRAEEEVLEHADEALRQSEERFRLLVQSLRDYAVFILDPIGKIVSWNPGAQRVYGYAEADILGHDISAFYSADQIVRNLPDQLLQTAASRGQAADEGWRIRQNGARFFAEVLVTPLRSREGRLLGFAKITRDITERKRAEEQIRSLNASLEQKVAERTAELKAVNQELEAFTYTVAHDLRGPLRGITGFLQMLQEQLRSAGPEELDDYLERGSACAKRMSNLIDDLLNLSRLSKLPLRRVPTDLNQLVQDARAEVELGGKERSIEWRIDSLPEANCDAGLLKQVFVNLLANAVKYTSNCESPKIHVGQKRVGREKVLFVADNGAGFDMKDAPKLFRPFSRLHSDESFPGNGIGLTTVERVLRRHGGRIWAEAAPEKGATFYFTIGTPLSEGKSLEPGLSQSSGDTLLGELTYGSGSGDGPGC